MKRSLYDVAQLVHGEVVGDGSVLLNGIASIRSATPADIVFVEEERNIAEALASRAGAVIVPKSPGSSPKPLLISEQPRLAFARAAEVLVSDPRRSNGIHPSALVDGTAQLAPDVEVGPYAVVGPKVVIGEATRVGSGSQVGAETIIGANCNIAANVTIYPGARLGNRVVVHAGAVLGSDGFGFVRDRKTGRYHKFPQVGRLEIEDDVEIGANCTLDRGALDVTRIARGTKIDNLVHIGHNVQIGEDVVIAAQTGLSGSAVLEKGVIVGGQVGIADHVRIEGGAILGAQCGVPSNKVIRGKGVVFWGTPARPIREYLKQLAVLARMGKRNG